MIAALIIIGAMIIILIVIIFVGVWGEARSSLAANGRYQRHLWTDSRGGHLAHLFRKRARFEAGDSTSILIPKDDNIYLLKYSKK